MVKVAINAQMFLGPSGGVGIFVGALITALGNLHDSNDSYVLVGKDENADWLNSIKGDISDI